jgi:hypothetical protein
MQFKQPDQSLADGIDFPDRGLSTKALVTSVQQDNEPAF